MYARGILPHDRSTKPVEPRLPGEKGVWIFILLDIGFFCLLFLCYALSESGDYSGFGKAQLLLETKLGLANTVVLLTSSWLVATSVQAVRRGDGTRASKLLFLACGLGLVFLGIKSIEYGRKFAGGIYLTTNDFFMYYFVVTFLHALHVLAGVLILFIMARRLRGNSPTLGDNKWVESAGIFWHTVDFLWVMIFALFYLISWQR